jgi:hypothetical protein
MAKISILFIALFCIGSSLCDSLDSYPNSYSNTNGYQNTLNNNQLGQTYKSQTKTTYQQPYGGSTTVMKETVQSPTGTVTKVTKQQQLPSYLNKRSRF